MISALQWIVSFIAVLAPLVFIHEFGHFIVAKFFRIGVPVFSLGFGPRIFGFTRGETEYRLSLIPLGGYVRLAGDEADENRTGGPEEFLSRPKYQRFLVFVAGAVFNIALAFVAMWIVFGVKGKTEQVIRYPTVVRVQAEGPAELAGIEIGDKILSISGYDLKEDDRAFFREINLAPNKEREIVVERHGRQLDLNMLVDSDEEFGLGRAGWQVSTSSVPQLGMVVTNGAADKAGLQVGDRILGANGKEPIKETEFRKILEESPGIEIPLVVERGAKIFDMNLTPADESGVGKIGVQFEMAETIQIPLSFIGSAKESLRYNTELSGTLFLILKRLVVRDIPLKTMSGPIGIAEVADQAIRSGWDTFLAFLAFVSLQLGILNLLPIPVLDGGHILILLVEGVMRRDLSERLKERVMQIGFLFLLVLMTTVIVMDAGKLINRIFG